MNKKILLVICILFSIVISCSAVSAGLFDSNSNVKTHEFNYANMASFNLSDELTDKTGVQDIVFGQGVSYKYPNGLVNMLGGIAHGGSDTVEYHKNNAFYEEIKSDPTSQGYPAYIFKHDNSEEYDVYIDLNNITIVDFSGFESQYDYFMGTFKSQDEAQIFIKTFKINETAIKT